MALVNSSRLLLSATQILLNIIIILIILKSTLFSGAISSGSVEMDIYCVYSWARSYIFWRVPYWQSTRSYLQDWVMAEFSFIYFRITYINTLFCADFICQHNWCWQGLKWMSVCTASFFISRFSLPGTQSLFFYYDFVGSGLSLFEHLKQNWELLDIYSWSCLLTTETGSVASQSFFISQVCLFECKILISIFERGISGHISQVGSKNVQQSL